MAGNDGFLDHVDNTASNQAKVLRQEERRDMERTRRNVVLLATPDGLKKVPSPRMID